MTDVTTIVATINGVKGAIEMAKEIQKAGVSLKDAETKAKIAGLISALADVQTQAASVQQTLLEKEDEIRALKKALDFKGKTTFKRPHCYSEGDPEPICQRCAEVDKIAVHPQTDGNGYWECKNCNTGYTDATFNAKPARVQNVRGTEFGDGEF